MEKVARRVLAPFRAFGPVFSNRDLRLLELSWAALSLAIWSYAIALGVYAFDAAGATAVGIVGLVRLLPGAFASPFAGLMGDRHSRRTVLILSALACALALAASALAALADGPAGLVFALAGIFTIGSSPYIPAEGALRPLISRTPQQLAAANVVHSAMENVGFLVGSVLTGVLLAVSGPELVFAVAAAAALMALLLLVRIEPDRRPSYAGEDLGSVMDEAVRGFHVLLADARLRLVGATLTLLVFFEGAADVLAVIVALDLLGLGPGSVGYLNAAWGVGALFGGAGLAVLLNRGNLAAGLAAGSLLTGAAMALPGAWPVPVAVFAAWFGVGFGYTLVEVTGRTLLQRLGSDETLARVLGTLETSRLAAMALGSVAASGLVALVGVRGAVLVMAALLPAFGLARWRALRSFEAGAEVPERRFALLRSDRIFEPLPVETLEGLCRGMVRVEASPGQEVITQGDHGDRYYLIDSGQVEVFKDGVSCGSHGEGESFGEIALLRDVARAATVRAVTATHLLAVDRDRFLAAVTGHARSHDAAHEVASDRLSQEPG